MSLPKIEEVLNLNDQEIENEIINVKKQLFELRLKVSLRQSFKPHSIKHNKHRLSQLLMVQANRKQT
jgi:large subunit ribosomal protein L29